MPTSLQGRAAIASTPPTHPPNPASILPPRFNPPQAKLEAFSAALERVAATMQAAPIPSALALRTFQFGQSALADAGSSLLGAISKLNSLMGQVFPGVRAAMGN